MTPTEVLQRFPDARHTSDGQYAAHCPCHDDRTASLCIGIRDQLTLIWCQAGCKTEDVVAAVGLRMADLMPHKESSNGKPRIVASYDYRDEAGELLYQVCRKEPKGFSQRRPDGNGGWQWSIKGVRRVLYRLPELLAADPAMPVYICEGEQDVDRLAVSGLVATSNAGGAGKWIDSYSEHLRGRQTVVLPDNDNPGRKHAQQVAESLSGVVASVRIVELPDLPDKGDVSDWLDGLSDSADPMELLQELAATTAEWTPDVRGRADWQPTKADVSIRNITQVEGRTEVANAQRLAAKHGADIRWCDPWKKWLVWDGKRWAIDDQRRIDTLAKQRASDLWECIASAGPSMQKETLDSMITFCRASCGATGIRNVLSLARSEPGIPVLPHMLDRDPWLLNVTNGTIDLRTGKLRPHDRGDLLTKLANVEYDHNADCPRWLQFVREVFDGNDRLIRFNRRAAGYSSTGVTIERCFFFLYGKGKNGKTTFVSTLQKLLGDYATGITTEMLMSSKGDRHPTEICDLAGARLAAAYETEDGRRFAESFVKQATGGEDRMKGRRMKEDFWEFDATHKLWISGNHRPRIHGTDDAIWDRVRLVPFNVRFDTPEKTLAAKLEAERSGILNWLILGAIEWQADGLGEPEEVKAATADYRAESDLLGQFINECCVVGPEYQVGASDLHKEYRDWGGSMTQCTFGKRLAERGYQDGRFTAGPRKGKKLWRGIGLLEADGSE